MSNITDLLITAGVVVIGVKVLGLDKAASAAAGAVGGAVGGAAGAVGGAVNGAAGAINGAAGAVGGVASSVGNAINANNNAALLNAITQWYQGAGGTRIFGITVGAYNPCDWNQFRVAYIAGFGVGADPGPNPPQPFIDSCGNYQHQGRPGGLGS